MTIQVLFLYCSYCSVLPTMPVLGILVCAEGSNIFILSILD